VAGPLSGERRYGTYSANVQSGCYWERLTDFQGTLSRIIAINFISGGTGTRDNSAGEVGFDTNPSCRTWTRTSSSLPFLGQTFSEIDANLQMKRLQTGPVGLR